MAKKKTKKTLKRASGSPVRKKKAIQKKRPPRGRRPDKPAKPKRPANVPPPRKDYPANKRPIIHDDREPESDPEDTPDGTAWGVGAVPNSFQPIPDHIDNLDDHEAGEQLSVREKTFVEAYLGVARCNASRAAKMAGYSGDARTIAVQGHRVLMRDKVQEVIADARLSLSKERDALVRLCLRNMGANMSEFLEPHIDGRGNMTVVVSMRKAASRGALRWAKELSEDVDQHGVVKRKLKLIDGRPWAELLAKLMGYSNERVLLQMLNKKGSEAGGKRLDEMNEAELVEELRELGEEPGDSLVPRADETGELPASAIGGGDVVEPVRTDTPGTGGAAHDPGE